MKSSKLPLIIVAVTISLLVVAGLAITLMKTENQDAQNDVVLDTALPDTVASDTILPQAKLPVLNIDGKENPDVYLQSLDIQVEVSGNIASTRYTMVFENRTSRILEGELTFPLPDGRTVTHYALDINGKMRDAVPVEKARATEVFEEIEQRQVDPGLLEMVEGNNFRTRIYPIPGNGTRTISIGYEEELTLERGLLYYRLPMAYPDSLKKFAVKATVWKGNLKPLVPESDDELSFDIAGENYVAAFSHENYRPSRALIFALPAPADIPQVMMQPAQGSYYFFTSVAPRMEMRKKQWSSNLAIIWDVSLSGSQRDLQREMEMLNMLFAENKDANVHLYFLNNTFKKIAKGNWKKLKSILEKAVYDGGTDFSKINLKDIEGDEILFFSDGISTLSNADFIGNTKVNRPIHSIVSSSKADYSTMKLIAGKTKGKFVNVNALSSEKLKDELMNETLQFLGTEHGNALREVYPSVAMPVQGNFSVAGISETNDAELTLLFGFGNKVEKRIKVKLDTKNASTQGNVYRIWAQKKIAELDLNYERNRAELTELGQQFGIVTRNTSLIVLETLSDYIRYKIEPPATEPELRAEYQRRQKENEMDRRQDLLLLEKAVKAAEDIKKWWDTNFMLIKPKYPTPDGEPIAAYNLMPSRDRAGGSFNDGYAEGGSGGLDGMLGSLIGGAGGMIRAERGANSNVREAPRIGNRKKEGGGGKPRGKGQQYMPEERGELRMLTARTREGEQPTITIKSIKKDNEYLKKLTGKTAEDYQIYLKSRTDYANSPTFYFDMADWFYTHKDREAALRILTSIADLELENASLYKLLGYRFKEYGEHVLEKFVYQKVIQWRPMEPQSYRDYALALAENGEMQAALDSLYSLLLRPYSERSRGIEEVVVMEINNLIAKNAKLNTSKIDKRLIMNIPIDIRVVINWNMNNTDIDLYVKDPNGEICSYSRRKTGIGGRISTDNTGGYGPEQFLLKRAIKGKYQVYVDYFGDRQFTAAGPSTIMAEIFTKYSDKTEQRQIVSLQMSKAQKKEDKKVEVAEFAF
ncbi:MAG: DUF2135 domain-containing protein [Fibromonadaceae bacterium]|jgi:hypothetical protein|nr:DUF2135 domain-containing protein [Fibromonadaceae bacterium]